MSIVRIARRERNFVVLQKDCLNEKQLSWGAKGLHSYLIGKPDDWQIRVSFLVKESKQG